jgi:tetratricopeptide (TPR) repeat protein
MDSARDVNSVTGSWINGPNIQIGSAGNVTLALGRADYQVQWLRPTPRDGRIPRRQRTPSYLLDARREVVPFWPRPDIQNVLLQWRDDPDDPASVLLVHGPGGQGKTRLANAFAGLCHESGWAVARAVSRVDSPGDVLPDGPNSAEGESPVLVVVDYAERWPVNTLAELIRSLVLDVSDRPLRVLLLARSRGQVWQALGPLVGRHIDVLDPVELGTMTSREEVFTQAAEAFQKALDRPGTITPPDLSHDDYGSVLMLHMAALAAVYQSSPTRGDLSTYLLEHEKRHWPLSSPTSDGVTPTQAADSVFLATLFGPFQNATDAMAVLAVASGQASARAILTWHDRLYPQDPTGDVYPALAPLRPDRFGEDFVAQRLTTEPRTAELLHQVLDTELLSEDAIRRCLIVLAAVADRHEVTRPILWSLLDDRRLAACVSASVIQTAIDHAPQATCRAIEDALPRYRVDLLQAAAVLTAHIVGTLPTTTSPATRGRYLNNLGVRLAAAGNKQIALAPAREAVDHYRVLADTDPAVYLPNLAKSLTNVGNRLAEVGDTEAALEAAREAVTICRDLVETDSDAYLPNLATSLNNVGNRLAAAGDRQAALEAVREAVTIRRALAETDPAHMPQLARSLNNLGLRLAEAGDKQAALVPAHEAVDRYRILAKADPDAYLPSLATGLSNLGIRLAENGDKQAALEVTREAVAIRGALAEADPAAYLPDLAASMSTLAWVQMLRSGQPSNALEEILDVADNACRLYKELARKWPEGFESELREARAIRAKVLEQLGRTTEP